MRKINSKIILLFVGMNFFNGSSANVVVTTEQDIEYQKEADKYKKLYEKYQRLADKAGKENVVEKFVDKNTLIESNSTTSSKDTKKPEVIAGPWKGTNLGFGGTIATGDSATTNVNALANVSYQPMDKWKNKLFFNYVYSTNDQDRKRAVKINKSQVRVETSWDFTKVNAAYGRLTYLYQLNNICRCQVVYLIQTI